MPRVILFLLLVVPAIVFSTELVINGDFEQPVGNEWEYNFKPFSGNIDTTDSDLEISVATITYLQERHVYLRQRIDITGYPPEFLTFSCNGSFLIINITLIPLNTTYLNIKMKK